ncbi:MAG: CRISPR-associated protein Csx15 [Syntrophobacteraceae bacterium]
MLVLNFSHPLTAEQIQQIEESVGKVSEERRIRARVDTDLPLVPQAAAIADASNLSPEAWQRGGFLIVPPSMAVLAIVLLAEIHGRMGEFPAIIRLHPTGELIRRHEVAEIINLQQVRDVTARLRRI